MASKDVQGQRVEASTERNMPNTSIELSALHFRGARYSSRTKEGIPAQGYFDMRNDQGSMPSLRVNSGGDIDPFGSITPLHALASNNPFRRLSPVHVASDSTSETSTSPLESPLTARQIEMEELETEEMELELRRRKIALRKKKLQAEEFGKLDRQMREAESQIHQRIERDLQLQARLDAERKDREQLESQKQAWLNADAERREEERVELERRKQLRLETERNEQEQIDQMIRLFEERKNQRLETERQDQERIEAEKSEKSKYEHERVEAAAQRMEADELEKKNIARVTLRHKEKMERHIPGRQQWDGQLGSHPEAQKPIVGIIPMPNTVDAILIGGAALISTGATPEESEEQTSEQSESLILMEQQGNVAKNRRISAPVGGDEFEVIDPEPSAFGPTEDIVHTGGSKELSSAPSTPPDSANVSRHASTTSQDGSMMSSRTDEELAWEIAAEASLNPANINELHPILQDQIKAAMHRHMPQEEINTVPAPLPNTARKILSESDIPSNRPPVPSKDTIVSQYPNEQKQSSHSAISMPPVSNAVSMPPTTAGRTGGTSSPRPPSKNTRASSAQWGGFESDAGVEPVDEDLCYCGRANASVEECYFCWPCDGTIFCKECWNDCPPHRKTSRKQINHKGSGLPHEKTDPAVARKIFDTLQSDRDHEEQALLHVQDEDTSWFGAGRDEDDEVVFQDFGRYARLMAEKSARNRQVRYPSLVSFVGQTGAGKSSLIRLLIELYAPDGVKNQVPVVGSNLHQDVPTSGDVHLYADPKTVDSENPIMHADCEGLDGGEREPMGAKARNKRDTKDKRTRSFVKHIRKQHHTSEREILWAKTDKTRSREYHVRHLYPRLLYTFSDVIVFVMKNPRVIENAIEQLIRWAEAALETSSNQPVLPHAIIVLNASDNASDPALWDVNNATINLMESVRRAVFKNHSMREFAETWRQRGRPVETVEMLLLSYYSTVRVVRVPERGRPNLINEQLQKLYLEISEACVRARESKQGVRMLLNSDELQPYLQYAFDHFSRDLDTPFDFVQASFSNNPIPADFGGNILKLAINIMEVWKDHLNGPDIFKELSFMVASCIMLDSARHRTLGPAEKVFPAYMAFCDTALDEFCNRHWPCEYVHPNTQGRCVNVKAGHQSKGHQLKSGKVLAVGSYTSVFTTENFGAIFRYNVYRNLQYLLGKLRAATMAAIHLELEKAAEIHRDVVLQSFYRHVSGSKAFISHTSCFSCLIAPPEHALPCGHVLCTPCVQAYSTARGRYLIEMAYCPLHHDDSDGQFRPRWPIVIKPSNAGVRVLSLDGGGVRGIVELVILQEIERSLGPGLPIQAFFDLIVGTSTGGIIALGLGANGWTVQKCILHFESLCREAFTRRGIAIPGIEWLSTNFSRYETKPMEHVLQLVFGEHNLFAGPKVDMDDPRVTQRLTKVAVTTTTTAGTAAVLANYNRMEAEEKPPYQFHRSEKPSAEIKTWQAARATSAAPTMFKPFAHDPSGQVYQDGALWYNCPIEVAMRERRLLWPDVAESHPDIVLSLGTGVNPKARQRNNTKISRFALFPPARALAKVAINQVEASLESEQTWRNFLLHNPPPDNVQGRFVRMNLVLERDPPRMDEIRSLNEMKEKTMSQFTARRRDIKNLADRLIATSFFFVPDGPNAVEEHQDESITFAGLIMCRFPTRSEEIQSLGDSLRTRLRTAYGGDYIRHNPYFVIRERGKHQNAKQIILTSEMVDRMISIGEFRLDRIDIHLAHRMVETEILFCLGDQASQPAFYPISGAPRCLMEDSTRGLIAQTNTQLRDLLTVNTGTRPKARTVLHQKGPSFDADYAGFEAQKAMWKFSSDDLSKGKDPFELYGSPAYTTPGNVPSDTISKISKRYSTMARSGTTMARSGTNRHSGISPSSTPMPQIPGEHMTPENIGSTPGIVVSEDTNESLSEALLDPESEHVRQQMLYLLLKNKGRPLPPKRESPPVKDEGPGPALEGGEPLYIPTIGFENRATKQRSVQEFVAAGDQYRLGFSAQTKDVPGVFELDVNKPEVYELEGDSEWIGG